jgi:high-affinity Fe2+/Pb2+ permease
MIAAFVLAAGGVKLALSQADRKRGLLMIVAAAVLVGNVLVWTL